MKHLLPVLTLALVTSVSSFAQSTKQVQWAFTSKKIADNTYEVHMTATVGGNWHIYSQNVGVEGPIATSFTFTKNPLVTADNTIKEVGNVIRKNEEVWGGVVNYYEKRVDFVQTVKLKGKVKTNLAGKVEFMVCNDSQCLPPATVDFKVNIGG